MNSLEITSKRVFGWGERVSAQFRNIEFYGVIVALAAVGSWTWVRVAAINPAILGDEYLYSINARKASPWDPALAGDFSNYLFNFVYQSTNLCGTSFYTCGKLLNLLFFLGFILILFVIARRFLPFWGALAFMVSAGLSPLSVYVSMFLPESMYFFFIGLVLLGVLRALTDFGPRNWAIAGIALGAATLVKPHAWLSALAIGVTFLVVALGDKKISLRQTLFSGVALAGAAVVTRVVVGVLVGGAKALGFFGQYFGVSTITQIATGPSDSIQQSVISTPMDGVVALFPDQLQAHVFTAATILSVSIIGLAVAVIDIAKTKKLGAETALGLFAFIWLAVLMLEIVAFTGWITGSGDDHSARILLRYYDFLYVIVPLAAIGVFARLRSSLPGPWIRWPLAVLLVALVTPATSGFFGSLTVQIADAPHLAGLIVNNTVFNAIAGLSVVSVAVFAIFPRFSLYAVAALLPLTFIATGWQIQDQYQMFRGETSPSDRAGLYLRENYSEAQLDDALILANSRFDATNVAIYADSAGIEYETYMPDAIFPAEAAAEGTTLIVTTGNITVTGDRVIEEIAGQGFIVYVLD